MGRTITPKYRLDFSDAEGWHTQAWHGVPSEKRLDDFVFGYADSLKSGGVNAHLSKALGYIALPYEAKIIRQSDGETVATWKAGAFQVF